MFVINRFGKCFELKNDVKASTDILISSGCEVFKDRNELYEKKKKTKEAQKKQRETMIETKEFRLSVNIDIHDFNTRVKQASKYLEKGHRIKASIRFRGREMAHTELGKDVLIRFADALKEFGAVEKQPTMEMRSMYMMIAPIKKEGK